MIFAGGLFPSGVGSFGREASTLRVLVRYSPALTQYEPYVLYFERFGVCRDEELEPPD
jgi:hypothetical protein